MVTTDRLFRIIDKFRDSQTAEIKGLKTALYEIVNSSTYAHWLGGAEFEGVRCPISNGISNELSRFGLLDDFGNLEIKVNKHRNKLLFTDGLWMDSAIRVFPFTDESQLLLRYVELKGYDRWANIVIDPATGSGNHVVGIEGDLTRIAFDVNPRAMAYTTINGLLNQSPKIVVGYNDVRHGLPCYLNNLQGNQLYLVNMPFALSPPPLESQAEKKYLPLHADGGLTGAEMSFAALSAINNLRNTMHQKANSRCVMLCYSVGNISEDRWEVVERAKRIFGSENVDWHLESEEKMWRVNGVKSEPNPMNLEDCLPKKADCRFYVQDESREEVRSGYYRLVEQLNSIGWDHLGYGILDIDIKR